MLLHKLTLPDLRVTLVVHKSTFQSTPSLPLNHELAKIQHHVQKDRLGRRKKEKKKKKEKRKKKKNQYSANRIKQ